MDSDMIFFYMKKQVKKKKTRNRWERLVNRMIFHCIWMRVEVGWYMCMYKFFTIKNLNGQKCPSISLLQPVKIDQLPRIFSSVHVSNKKIFSFICLAYSATRQTGPNDRNRWKVTKFTVWNFEACLFALMKFLEIYELKSFFVYCFILTHNEGRFWIRESPDTCQ